MLQGVMTAIVTPFKDGHVDEQTFQRLVERQVQAGVAGVVVCGSTGEAATLSDRERAQIVQMGIDICAGNSTEAWVGTGTNNTRTSIELTRAAEAQGASGAMIVAPYYNKPSSEGLYQHFSAVAQNCSIPLILYNVPGRTGVHVEPHTIARVHELGRYVALKEASGSLDQVSDVIEACDMTVLSGDDALTVPMMSLGAQGVISVVSNLFPDEINQMVQAYLRGKVQEARDWHFRLLPFFRGAFIESNPTPIKVLLSMAGLCGPEVRAPLAPATDATQEQLKQLMQQSSWSGVTT